MKSVKHSLLSCLPAEQIDEVFGQDYCELDYEFLGFMDIYERLAAIIPIHFTVIDLGCYCAAQTFYFKDYRRYMGVDVFQGKRFRMDNTVHYAKSIQRFIAEDLRDLDLNETFAICSYVPDDEARQLVRNAFPNVFVYYPSDKNGFQLKPKSAAGQRLP